METKLTHIETCFENKGGEQDYKGQGWSWLVYYQLHTKAVAGQRTRYYAITCLERSLTCTHLVDITFKGFTGETPSRFRPVTQ